MPKKFWIAQELQEKYRELNGNLGQLAILSQDKNILTFIGDIQSSAPRFRFIYKKMDNNTLRIKFEIAPPGKPEEFAPYIEASAQRKFHL